MYGYRKIHEVYEKVNYRVYKNGKCSVCGKNAARQEILYQTINPFNKNPDGTIKDRYDIYKELKIKADEWRAKPLVHAKCEGK
jgi:hypothetical protein